MISDRLLRVLLPLLLVVVAGLVYWPGLYGGFIFDDYNNIVLNPRIQAETIDWDSLKRAALAYEPGMYGRPVATISFAFDYYFHGKAPWGYKLSSLCVHLVNAVLVFLLVSRLLGLARARSHWHRWAPFAIAFAWAVHPLQVSTVLYVVQRMEMLATTFVIAALLAYLSGRRAQIDGRSGGWLWLALSGVLMGVGMLSKESAILFPAFALALEFTLLGFDARKPRDASMLKTLYALGIVAASLLFVFYVLPDYTRAGAFDGRPFTLSERLLSQLRILPMHLGQILLPIPGNMGFYYDAYPKSTGLLSPWTTLLGGIFLAILLALAWRVRRNLPVFSLGILWFFAAHAITSNVFNLELVFEHRNYFALLGIVLAAADLIHRIPMRDGPALKIAAVAMAIVMFGVLATIRSATWGDPLLLASDLVAKSPESPRASNDLATIYVDMSGSNPDSPFYSFALKEFERGSRLPAASPLPEQGLILMAATTGETTDPAWWDRLIHKVRTQPVGPQQTLAVDGLLKQFNNGIRIDPVRLAEAYQSLLDRQSWPAYRYAEFGDFLLRTQGDQDLATRMFLLAVSRDPADQAFARLVLGNLIADGHGRQAAAVLAKMEELGISVNEHDSRQPGP